MSKPVRKLTLESSVKSLALKFYDDQLIFSFGSDAENDAMNTAYKAYTDAQEAFNKAKEADKPALEKAKKQAFDAYNKLVYDIVDSKGYWKKLCDTVRGLDPADYQVLAICHDADFLEDNFFVPSAEKRHYHLIERYAPRQGVKRNPTKVRVLLNLLGLKYRPSDESLVLNKGIETVNDFGAYVDYLTHDDRASALAGKTGYEHAAIVSNLEPKAIDDIRKGFTGNQLPHKWDIVTLREACETAASIGYAGRSYSAYAESVGRFVLYSQSKEKIVRRFYDEALDMRLNEHRDVNRLCLFIESPQNAGKTTASKLALSALGIKNPLFVTNNGTGKYDALSIDNDALVLDDVTGKDLLNVSDQYECRLYKRNNGDAVWGGTHLIVTNNHDFDKWLERSCGVSSDDSYEKVTLDAVRSRWYAVKLLEKDGKLAFQVTNRCERGGRDKRAKLEAMFKAFMREFMRALLEFRIKEKEAVSVAADKASNTQLDIPADSITEQLSFVNSMCDGFVSADMFPDNPFCKP